MNRMLTSVLVVGAGMAAMNYMQKNNMMDRRQMKRLQKKLTKAIF
ncbi:MAG: YrzQ family protein [Bacillota bacterium]